MNKIIAAAIAAALVMPAAALAASGPKVKIGGGIQMDYRHGYGVSTTAGYASQEFNVRRARLIFNGKVNDLVGFGATLQGDNSGGTIFRDMFGTLTFTPLTKVTFGQFKYEFDMEGRESSFDRMFMDRTDITNAVAGAGGLDIGTKSFRDKGVQLSGKIDMGGMGAGYAVGVFGGNGGAGVATNPQDSNNKFMYTANLFVMPMPGLKLNGGYMNNDRTPSNTTGVPAANHYVAYTLGAAYDAGPLLARGEYYRGASHFAAGDETTKGWYVLGGYRVLPDVDVFARYQKLNTDGNGTLPTGIVVDTNGNGVVDNSFHSTDIGAKYYFTHKGRHGGSNVAVNYMMRSAGEDYTTTMLNDGRGIAVGGASIQPVEKVVAARLQVAF